MALFLPSIRALDVPGAAGPRALDRQTTDEATMDSGP